MRPSLTAVMALALVPLSQAWNVELPPCLDQFKPFVSSGCFQDGDPPALIYRSGLDQGNMTVEKCVAECKGNGFRYAGLKYYGVCFCGPTVNGPQVDASKCSFPCSGNKSETCGGDSTLSVWQDPTFSKGPNDVTVDDYKSLGCYTDDSKTGRTLSWPVNMDAATFTTKKCLAACEKGGFPFAGTEYGGECWCGVVLANYTAKVADKECNMPCRGDDKDTCGGRSRLTLYVAKDLESLEPCGFHPPPPSTTTGSTTTAGSSTKSGPTTTARTTATTTTDRAPTTTSVSLCTATSTVPPKCEWQCGNWCAPPLPDWDNELQCLVAAKTCALQILSCFKYAGWPNTIDCFDFQRWCGNVQKYCFGGCRDGDCRKDDCWDRYKPGRGRRPVTTTSVFPCPPDTATAKPPATATATAPATSCPPVPTNICTQPTNDGWGYGPGKPVGGIPLPVVGCNDIRDDWRHKPYKYYTEPDSASCPSFLWPEWPNVCTAACREQYQQCRDTYVNSCRRRSRNAAFYRRQDGEGGGGGGGEADAEFERRWLLWSGSSTEAQGAVSCAISGNLFSWAGWGSDSLACWGWGGNSPDTAERRCLAQLDDCLDANRDVDPGDGCQTWCHG